MPVPWWAWASALSVVAVLIGADLALTGRAGSRRQAGGSGRADGGLRTAAVQSGLWIAAGLAFGGLLWWWQGQLAAGQYLASYLLEKSLSVDNIFVFVLLFAVLGVPAALQRRVLFFGVIGALIARGGLIAAGGALIAHTSWIFYVFGALVLLAAARMLRPGDNVADPGKNRAVRILNRVLPVTETYHGNRFFIRRGGRVMVTPLLVALVAVEITDLVFALDSIPAVFGVTRDVFIVFTSNAFAVLGLRALFFLLAGSVQRFAYLRQGLAVLLAFIGVKMLISRWVHLPVTVSLAVIVMIIAAAVTASVWRDRASSRLAARPAAQAAQQVCR